MKLCMDGGNLKYSYKRINSNVAYCALSVKVGTRNEVEQFNGMAHLVEHMLFKGTEHRNSISINSRLEKEGGDLNAYTTKEEIVLYCTLLKEDLAKGVDLLLEMALDSVFPEKELEKEKEVVYDEIISYKDSPADQIYDDFEGLLFKGHPLGKLILGTKKSLKGIGSGHLLEFCRKNFIPGNMALSVVANVEARKIESIVRRSLKHYRPESELQYIPDETTLFEQPEISDNYSSLLIGNRFSLSQNKHLHQSHCIIGCSAHSMYSNKERCTLALVANMLGGPASNSLLNTMLREKYALVYNVEAAYTPYSDTGIFTVYFGCDASNTERCKSLVYAALEKFSRGEISQSKLKNAKKQFVAQMLIAADNLESQALGMSKAMLVFNQISPFELSRRMIEQISLEDVLNVCSKVFKRSRLSELIYC